MCVVRVSDAHVRRVFESGCERAVRIGVSRSEASPSMEDSDMVITLVDGPIKTTDAMREFVHQRLSTALGRFGDERPASRGTHLR